MNLELICSYSRIGERETKGGVYQWFLLSLIRRGLALAIAIATVTNVFSFYLFGQIMSK